MLEKLIPENYQGVVSVRRGGKIVFQGAYGFADLPNKIHNRMDTRFGTASAGKAFVAAGIMKLIEEGKLTLNTTIGDAIKIDWKKIDPRISVRELLNHTSGIPDYFDESVMDDYAELFYDYPNYKIRTSMDLVPLFIDKPMIYKRGERFQYNNTGYAVLGLMIESVTKLPFDLYLKNAVFEPCGMTSTGYYELDRLPANCANAYIFDEERKEFYTNIYSIDVKGTGAGGAFMTAPDAERFWDGLLSGKIVSRETLQDMVSPQAPGGEYGYGFWIREDDKTPYFQGSDPGVSFLSSFDEKSGLTITLFSNFGDDVWELNENIREHIGLLPGD